MFNTKLN